MGGNVTVNGQGSEPITINMRKGRVHDVDRMLHSINRHSKQKIFGYGAPSLVSGGAYSGSTVHMMNKELKDEELRKYKKSFGDVDVMVPHQHKALVEAALQPGTKHGKFTVVGTKQLGGQLSAVMKHDDGKNHQVDFEYKPFDEETQEPTDFAKFSQNSDLADLKTGIKGAAHKQLILSLTARKGQRGVVEKIKNGQSVYGPETQIKTHTFSQLYGVRRKHLPSHDKDGKQKMHNGKPVFNELGSENADYETDLGKIHECLFGVPGKESDIKAMHSFHGVAKSMKKHLEPHEQRNVIHDFASKLYDKRAATHMDGNPTKDNQIKVHTLRELRKHFPEHFDKLMYETIAAKRENYYDKPAKQLKEESEMTLKVAFTCGRFTGPTREHEKLLDLLFAEQADSHRVYVMGPLHANNCTDRDPLTVHEKVRTLKYLYPEHADCFYAADGGHRANLTQCLADTWHQLYIEADGVDLVAFAGDGDAGVVGKDAGGSAAVVEDMLNRLNGTKYKLSEDFRMNFTSYKVKRNPRGNVSGTFLRESAAATDLNNVETLRELLHTRITTSQIKRLVEGVHRQRGVGIADVIGENYEFVEQAADGLDVPIDIVESIVKQMDPVTREDVQDICQSMRSRRSLFQLDENLLDPLPDTYVVFYHPQKLYHQIDCIKTDPSTPVTERLEVKARVAQGFDFVSAHGGNGDPLPIGVSHQYRNRQFRRQIDDLS